MFQLVTLTGGAPVPVLMEDGKPFLFDTGKEAAEAARKLTSERGERVQPRPLEDDGEWKRREALRFEDGTYTHVPFHNADWFVGSDPWREHFLHVSTERTDMVAFTESPAKGAADRQTRLKVGVYLQRYFSDVLSPDEIRDIATEFTAEREENTILFAKTADEIEEVYVTGPRSCMAHPPEHFDSPFHPVRVYAAGDLEVAYLKRDGRITARALVWPEKMRFGRPYGDILRIDRLLKESGYRRGSLDGARMLRVAVGRAFVAPYVDGSLRARDDGKFLIIDDEGEISCDEQNGLAEAGRYCGGCDEVRDPEEFGEVHFLDSRGRTRSCAWCGCCIDSNAFTCDATGELWMYGEGVEMANGETWSLKHFRENGFVCDGNGGNYPDSEMVTMANGDSWSQEHFEGHGFTCPDCGDNFPVDEGIEVEGDLVCAECAERRQGAHVVRPATKSERKAAEKAGQMALPVALPERKPRKPGEFRVGDRVMVSWECLGLVRDQLATVVLHDRGGLRPWLVEFDEGCPDGLGHTGGGKVPSGRGWWCRAEHLTLIAPAT